MCTIITDTYYKDWTSSIKVYGSACQLLLVSSYGYDYYYNVFIAFACLISVLLPNGSLVSFYACLQPCFKLFFVDHGFAAEEMQRHI